MDANLVAQRLRELVPRVLGAPGTVSDLESLTAGANKGTWAFNARIGDRISAFILQQAAATDPEVEDEASTGRLPHLDGSQEFEVMRAAASAGVPVPSVKYILAPADGLGQGAITGLIAGETLGPRIVRNPEFAGARAVLARQCGAALASIHRIDPRPLPFLRRLGASQAIDVYRRILDSFDYPQPALEMALRWARERATDPRADAVVHGDFRTGNLIVGPEGLRAVLDWEIAHLGDPMEDLGYLCMRTWRFAGKGPVGGFGERRDLFAAYEESTGIAVDPEVVRFWEVLGCMRWALGCMRRATQFRDSPSRQLEFAGIGRRLEEPVHDMLELIDGRA